MARRVVILGAFLCSAAALAEDLLFSSRQWGNINLHIEQSSASRSMEAMLASNPNFELLRDYPEHTRLRRLSRPIGRLDVRFPSGDFMTCTASLISVDRLLTNHHCVPGTGDYGTVTEASLLMGYYSNTDKRGTERFTVNVRPIEASRDGDYAILRVRGQPGDAWGTVRLTTNKPRPGEPLLLVHHPAAEPKHVTRGKCRAGRPTPFRDGVLFHKCDTLRGSSGAPIFSDDSGDVLALHYGGAPGPGPDRYNHGKLIGWLRQSSSQIAAVLESSPSIPLRPPDVSDRTQPAGSIFRDRLHDDSQGPEMVVIPVGQFEMGCVSGKECQDDELPVRTVTFDKSFAIGKYEVTFEQYDEFAEAIGRKLPHDEGWGRGRRPVINVSWNDAVAYVKWLSQETGKRYRLPSEAEWEYAARAGTETAYWWGNDIAENRANCIGCGSQWDDKKTAPVGSFEANPFGLYDTSGNLWEWVSDCNNENYKEAPTDGAAWLSGDCTQRVFRGGSWGDEPQFLRSASRFIYFPNPQNPFRGFRLARDL